MFRKLGFATASVVVATKGTFTITIPGKSGTLTYQTSISISVHN